MYLALAVNNENGESEPALCRDRIVFHCMEVPYVTSHLSRKTFELEMKLKTKSPANLKTSPQKQKRKHFYCWISIKSDCGAKEITKAERNLTLQYSPTDRTYYIHVLKQQLILKKEDWTTPFVT